MNLISLFFTLAILLESSSLASETRAFSACIDERPWVPFTSPDARNPGQMQVIVDAVARELRYSVQVVVLPWRRCLESVRSGKIDALIGAGDVPYTRELAEFPRIGNVTDTGRSLGKARIMLVKRQSSTVGWDGSRFIDLKRPVGVSMGTQIMLTTVKDAGAVADDGGKTDLQNIRKLLESRVDLMAAYEFDLKELLAKGFLNKVEVLPVPLNEANYYLAFSKVYYARNAEAVEAIWNKIGTIRNLYIGRDSSPYRYNIETSSADAQR